MRPIFPVAHPGGTLYWVARCQHCTSGRVDNIALLPIGGHRSARLCLPFKCRVPPTRGPRSNTTANMSKVLKTVKSVGKSKDKDGEHDEKVRDLVNVCLMRKAHTALGVVNLPSYGARCSRTEAHAAAQRRLEAHSSHIHGRYTCFSHNLIVKLGARTCSHEHTLAHAHAQHSDQHQSSRSSHSSAPRVSSFPKPLPPQPYDAERVFDPRASMLPFLCVSKAETAHGV